MGVRTSAGAAGFATEKIARAVTVMDSENGTIAAALENGEAATKVEEVERVYLTVTPDAGYELISLSVKDSNGNEITVKDDYSFLMPRSAVTISATFTQEGATQNKINYQPIRLSESFLDDKGGNGIGTATDYNVPDKEAVLYPDEYFFYDKSYSDSKDSSDYDGYTGDIVGEGLEKEIEGFYSLAYKTSIVIAADGSTEVEIYYDRFYYLMSFGLSGGYGTDPIYARYESSIDINTPKRPGYTFNGWDRSLPDTMPVGGGHFEAQWIEGEAPLTVVFWYENANDNKYTDVGSIDITGVSPGDVVSSSQYKDYSFDGRDDEHE